MLVLQNLMLIPAVLCFWNYSLMSIKRGLEMSRIKIR